MPKHRPYQRPDVVEADVSSTAHEGARLAPQHQVLSRTHARSILHPAANELGRVYIDPSIITRVCILTELSLSDVFVLPTGPVPDDPVEQVSLKGVEKYVHVDFSSEGKVTVELRVLVRYGPPIRSSAALFQEKVERRIEASTGLEVARVDIKVDGLYQPTEPATLPPPEENQPRQIEHQQDSGS